MKRLMVVIAAALSLQSAGAFAASGDSMNFRFSPIGLIIGAIGINLDFAVHENWTIGPEASYWRLKLTSSGALTDDIEITAYSFGARANWFKNGNFTDGLYVGPSLKYASAKASSSDASGTVEGTASALVASALVGYGWFWDSFNMMLGGGVSVPLGDNKVEVTDSNGSKTESKIDSGLALEFSLGWTF